ncbi:hypothetical protein ACFX2F_044172 [Malus domestica]
MTGDNEAFSFLAPFISDGVMFGGGDKSQIIGKCDVKIPGLPKLENVSYVDGLKSNLISISQLYDDVVDEVCFSKRGCLIMDKHGKNLLVLSRSRDNCYILDVSKIAEYSMCHKAINETSVLWHNRLRHANFKDFKKLSKHEVVKGLPPLSVSNSYVCGSCQLGKQSRMAHKKVTDIGTTKPLQLIHMDLVGPIHTLSLDGKKYILVIVNDYSRFTWVCFLRKKSDTFQQFFTVYKVKLNQSLSSHSALVKIRTNHGIEFENAQINVKVPSLPHLK